jgi:hypothetical protein
VQPLAARWARSGSGGLFTGRKLIKQAGRAKAAKVAKESKFILPSPTSHPSRDSSHAKIELSPVPFRGKLSALCSK